jgi:triphosphoribosyl-dephospho-CoA synthetase
MKNLTLSIDEDVLLEARKFALEHKTTVNHLVRSYLEEIAGRRDRRRAARERLLKLMSERRVDLGGRRWVRDDVYER